MKNRIVLDTNFIYSLMVIKDPNNNQAIDIFAKLDPESEFIVPQIVVTELLISTVQTDFIDNCKQIAKRFTLNNINDLKFIKSLDNDKKKQLKAADCLILSICSRYKAKLLTFDKNLLRAYDELLEPKY